MKNLLLASAAVLVLLGCTSQSTVKKEYVRDTSASHSTVKDTSMLVPADAPMADAATIMARTQVPVLCYHHIKEFPSTSKSMKAYTVTISQFAEQMKALADSGYHSILPDQLYNYLVFGKPLPSKPVMITFDDTDEEQFSVGKKEMDKYGFKGVYFIMNISIGRPNYMTREQIKQLADEGHAIAGHTYDHHRTDKYISGDHMAVVNNKQKKVNDWDDQLLAPRKKLEEITGKNVEYFAYPFGVWASSGIPEIRNRGYKLAFQLAGKRDPLEPLYTVRRIIVPGWTGAGLVKAMRSSFQ